jgi:hypothetical protein
MTFILENTQCLNERAEVAFPGGSPATTLSGLMRTADEPKFRSRAGGKGKGRRRKEAINPHGSGSAAQQTQWDYQFLDPKRLPLYSRVKELLYPANLYGYWCLIWEYMPL